MIYFPLSEEDDVTQFLKKTYTHILPLQCEDWGLSCLIFWLKGFECCSIVGRAGVKSTVDWHDERGFTFFHFTIKPSSDGCGLTSHKCCSCFDYYEALKGGM